jgi:hypothetical protein
MVVAFLTGHTSVKKHLNFMGWFNGNLDCRYCKMDTETVYLIVCCCKALASQHCNFLGMIPVESEDISMASFKDL